MLYPLHHLLHGSSFSIISFWLACAGSTALRPHALVTGLTPCWGGELPPPWDPPLPHARDPSQEAKPGHDPGLGATLAEAHLPAMPGRTGVLGGLSTLLWGAGGWQVPVTPPRDLGLTLLDGWEVPEPVQHWQTSVSEKPHPPRAQGLSHPCGTARGPPTPTPWLQKPPQGALTALQVCQPLPLPDCQERAGRE